MAKLDAVRAAQDAAYADSLTDSEWQALAQDPTWQQLQAEQPEFLVNVLAAHGSKLPGAGTPSTNTEIPIQGPFKVIGTDISRMQGIGIVTNQGQYTEHTRVAGMLFMRTLRSKYP